MSKKVIRHNKPIKNTSYVTYILDKYDHIIILSIYYEKN